MKLVRTCTALMVGLASVAYATDNGPGHTINTHLSRLIEPTREVPQALMSCTFSPAGDFATGDTTLCGGMALTITRSSVATYENPPGTLVTAAANRLRVEAYGALIENAATNHVLNSATHPKTSEATAALALGLHVAWHDGTGTMTLVAGTAVVTGLSCSAVSAGTLCTFTVTTGGTMLITTTAGTTRAQLEAGTVRTSYIDTAGTATARGNDFVTTATSPWLTVPSNICLSWTMRHAESSTSSSVNWINTGTPVDADDELVVGGVTAAEYIVGERAGGTMASIGTAWETTSHVYAAEWANWQVAGHIAMMWRDSLVSTFVATAAARTAAPNIITIGGSSFGGGFTTPWVRFKNLRAYDVSCTRAGAIP